MPSEKTKYVNKVKPTAKQRLAVQHLMAGLTKQEAMLKAGYSAVSSLNPNHNLTERAGVKSLMEEYREELKRAGVSLEILAEVEAAGLFDENATVRLGYLKEAKKTLGVAVNDMQDPNIKRRIVAEEFFGGEE